LTTGIFGGIYGVEVLTRLEFYFGRCSYEST
jgi:hypothetical protein